jgi:hypothetical protein
MPAAHLRLRAVSIACGAAQVGARFIMSDSASPLLPLGALKPLQLLGRTLLPIVQGGMGVGVSAHRLAGSVAAENAVGTISRSTCGATTPT